MVRVLPFALALLGAGSVWSQSVISAHSGVLNYVEGQVTLDGNTVQPKFGEFPDVKAGQELAAADGRAEVLLTPGVFLRLAENSSFRMVSNKLADTRVEVLTGSALVEVGELLTDNAIALQFHDAQVALLKKGLYRIDADDPGRLRVYEGEARVTSGSQTLAARRGREVQFGAVLQASNFDTKSTDAFYRWSARRSEYIADANVSAARSARDQGFGYSGSGYAPGSWAWNPYFGQFTYLPGNGIYMSPFGSSYYSPGFVSYFSPSGIGVFNGVVAAPRTGSLLGASTAAPRSGGLIGSGSSGARSSGGFSGGHAAAGRGR